MAEKPILFITEMVKAILEGRKTQTRRVIKAKSRNAMGFYVTFREHDNEFAGVYDYDEHENMFENPQTPPCDIGDVLWVRETWCVLYELDKYDQYIEGTEKYHYRTNKDEFRYLRDDGEFYNDPLWKPSIHMPREAARIFLKVTDVRVERLQNISNEDCIKEGCTGIKCDCINIETNGCCTDCYNSRWLEPPIANYPVVWDKTIKKQDLNTYGWDANPWVWVISFDRITNG